VKPARVAVLSHPNHGFDACAATLAAGLAERDDLAVTLTEDQGELAAGLDRYDVVVIGSGLTHRVGEPGAPDMRYVPAFTAAESDGLLSFVRRGGGFVGLHITGWYLGGQDVLLVGGSANLHPPNDDTRRFTVRLDRPEHEILDGVEDFDLVDDEIYQMSWSPETEILASTVWGSRDVPVLWTHAYGSGRVFYSSVGHLPVTYENPAMRRVMHNAVRWAARPAPKGQRA
jgi:type 1 glutamine amidotransferase